MWLDKDQYEKLFHLTLAYNAKEIELKYRYTKQTTVATLSCGQDSFTFEWNEDRKLWIYEQ